MITYIETQNFKLIKLKILTIEIKSIKLFDYQLIITFHSNSEDIIDMNEKNLAQLVTEVNDRHLG